ncbi:uncharacterized protein B0H18DRAFT_53085 [Fomitopsis serialis]|uniref:uncharacterized protein n=1 Tax=Fomitopsis serialis TaxID=139415 RepID=UPI002008A082|nr:uncharacterized protein B0H18DRAFT_53085 [Neoantrodia serialis]KAH9932307.1 hypothetical protein B0H18DRAFT_53085 [Neoantrodia serialis]
MVRRWELGDYRRRHRLSSTPWCAIVALGVFRDMFGIASPDDGETIEGCPVVRVSDAASGMRNILWVVYTGRTFTETESSVQFADAAVLLRLAHKYDFDKVRDDALARIKTLYTDNFQNFVDQSPGSHPLLSHKWQDAFEAVQLARLTNTKSILPVALYFCCKTQFFNDATAISRLCAGTDTSQADVHMADDDILRCLVARPRLIQARIQVLCSTFAKNPGPRCDRDDCREYHDLTIDTIVICQSSPSYRSLDVDCLTSCLDDEEIQSVTDYFHFCDICQKFFKERDLAARQSVWKQLPGYFGLDIAGWE